jgi:hypothetical protein
MVPHPAANKNNVKNEPARVFFMICIAFPFRSHTGHPLKPACVLARYGERGVSDAGGEYGLVGRDTTGQGNRMGSVGMYAEI